MNLVRIELERNNIKSYIMKGFIVCGVILAIMIMVFFDEEIYKNVSELLENWPSMIYIVSLLALFSYSILAAVMYSKFIVSEYSGKKAILLFQYPIERKSIVNVKCTIITVFSILSVILTNLIIFGIFIGVSVGANPREVIISADSIVYLVQMLSITVVFSVVISIISGYLGLSSDSIQTTIVAAIIICVIATQIIGQIYSGEYDANYYTKTVLFVDGIMIVIGAIVHRMLVYKINVMELE